MNVLNPFPKQKLIRTLRFAIANRHSDFYRATLRNAAFLKRPTHDTWQDIPFITKKDIQARPLSKRIFMPRSKIDFIRHTSGTSGAGILTSPRILHGDYAEPLGRMGATKLLNFLIPTYYGFPQGEIDLPTTHGDIHAPEATAQFAATEGIDGLSMTPQAAIFMADFFRRHGLCQRVRGIMLCGERCSAKQFEHLKTLYPNATVFGSYATSEGREGAVACSCAHDRKKGGSLIMRALPYFYCEIVDAESGEVITEYDHPGELVVTTTHLPQPFPFIRYRSGDTAMYVRTTCACKNPGFDVQGRITVLPIRIPYGDIGIEKVERAIAAVGYPVGYFEVHYRESERAGKVLPAARLVLVGGAKKGLAEAISKALQIGATYTYADGVKKGVYHPLEVTFISSAPIGNTGKHLPPKIMRDIVST